MGSVFLVILHNPTGVSSFKKDVLPSHHCSNAIYQFLCNCDSCYVDRTSRRFQERLNNLFPSLSLVFPLSRPRQSSPSYKANGSSQHWPFFTSLPLAIGQRVLEKRNAFLYSDSRFSIRVRGCSTGRNKKIQIFEFYYGRLVPCCYGQDKRLGQILR